MFQEQKSFLKFFAQIRFLKPISLKRFLEIFFKKIKNNIQY